MADRTNKRSVAVRWAMLAILLLALILVPFTLFEEPLDLWAKSLLHPESRQWAAIVVIGLLALDIVLPVPSSLVSTAAGSLLGFWGGMLASAIGMTAGALIGFGLGRALGPGVVGRFVGEREVDRVRRAWDRHGDWVVVLFRAVPVLAEASVVFAGLAGMRAGRFLVLAGVTNLCISAVYAAAGAYAVQGRAFLLAFVAAMVLPLLATVLARRRSV